MMNSENALSGVFMPRLTNSTMSTSLRLRIGEGVIVHGLAEVDCVQHFYPVSVPQQELSALDQYAAFGSSTFTLFFFRKFETALYDVGSQREFERISFKTLSFMVAFPFSAKRKMTL